MRIGDLRHRVTLQTPTSTVSDSGSESIAYTDWRTVWASVEPLQGREYWAAQQLQAEVTAKITMRYLSGVLPTMRIKFGSRHFDIKSIINVNERDRELVLICSEAVS